jgi:hypothetical protein
MACKFHHVVKYSANADEFTGYPIGHEVARALDNAVFGVAGFNTLALKTKGRGFSRPFVLIRDA